MQSNDSIAIKKVSPKTLLHGVILTVNLYKLCFCVDPYIDLGYLKKTVVLDRALCDTVCVCVTLLFVWTEVPNFIKIFFYRILNKTLFYPEVSVRFCL